MLSQSHFSPCPSLHSQCGRQAARDGSQCKYIFPAMVFINNNCSVISQVEFSYYCCKTVFLDFLEPCFSPMEKPSASAQPFHVDMCCGVSRRDGQPKLHTGQGKGRAQGGSLWSTRVCGSAVGTRQDDVCLAEVGRTGEESGPKDGSFGNWCVCRKSFKILNICKAFSFC